VNSLYTALVAPQLSEEQINRFHALVPIVEGHDKVDCFLAVDKELDRAFEANRRRMQHDFQLFHLD